MIAVTTDAAKGVTDRFRSMPMAPSAVVVGRSVADMLNSRARPGRAWSPAGCSSAGAGTTASADGAARGRRCCCCCGSRCCGSASTSAWSSRARRRVMAVQILVWPLGFLSNAFAAPEHDAGLARHDRRVEPAVGHGRRHPRAVRQPRLGRRVLGRPARAADGGRLAAGDRRGLLPAWPSTVGNASAVDAAAELRVCGTGVRRGGAQALALHQRVRRWLHGRCPGAVRGVGVAPAERLSPDVGLVLVFGWGVDRLPPWTRTHIRPASRRAWRRWRPSSRSWPPSTSTG